MNATKKPSQLKRDSRTTVTYNALVKDILKERGLSIQEFFDMALDNFIKERFEEISQVKTVKVKKGAA